MTQAGVRPCSGGGLTIHKCSALAAVLAIVVYLNTLDCGMVYDDEPAILSNKDLRPETPWTSLLFHDFWGAQMTSKTSHKSYRPLCVATFRLNYLLHELQPMGYHLVNVLLHGAVCYLYVQLCGVVFSGAVWPALIAGLLFAVHPIHTEAVAGIVGRADLLASVFFILSFLSYNEGIVQCHSEADTTTSLSGHSVSHSYLIRCFLFMLCAVTSKELGLTVVGVCLTYDLFLVNKASIGDLWRYVSSHPCKGPSPFSRQFLSRLFPLALFTVAILIGRLWLMKSAPVFTKYDNEALSLSSPYRQLQWSYLVFLNSYLLFNPSVLSHDYRMGIVPLVKSIMDPRLLLVIGTTAFYASLLLYAFTRTNFDRPTSGAVRPRQKASHDIGYRTANHQTVSHMTDDVINTNTAVKNWTGKLLKWYLSHCGKSELLNKNIYSDKEVLLFGLSLMIFPFLPASNLFFPVGFVVAERVLYLPSMGFCMLVAYGAHRLTKTRHRWLSAVTHLSLVLLLSSHVTKTVHRSDDWYSKETLYKSMLKHNPTNGHVLGNLALDLYRHGDEKTAEQLNRYAMLVAPRVPLSYVNLGTLLKKQGRLREAEKVWREAVVVLANEEDPKTDTIAQIYSALCSMLSQQDSSRLKEALELCNTAVAVRNDLPHLHTTRGTLLMRMKSYREAKLAFEQALYREPQNADNLFNLALAHKSMGNKAVAMEILQHALAIDHTHKLAQNHLSKLKLTSL